MTKFSVVATPIGNLKDITNRAIETISGADVIACEDTRETRKLLSSYGISTQGKVLVSYHAHSSSARPDQIIERLKEGKNVALVTDAGTPAISDPGSVLVAHIRSELSEEILGGSIVIEAVPGPSALTTALSIAGVPCSEFIFLGFMPHKKGRETLFKEIAESKRTVIFYESPHRIEKTLISLVEHLGFVNELRKKVTVCRELTKVFEEVISGNANEVLAYYTTNPDKVRGEFVVIVSVE